MYIYICEQYKESCSIPVVGASVVVVMIDVVVEGAVVIREKHSFILHY
jgi:hypothetical protein